MILIFKYTSIQNEEPEAISKSKRKQKQTMRMPNNIHAMLNNSSNSSPIRAGSFHTTTNSCEDIDQPHFWIEKPD